MSFKLTWPLPLWLQAMINFLIAFTLTLVLDLYTPVPTNAIYILTTAVIIFDGTHGTIKTGVQRIAGTVVGLGIGLALVYGLNALPPSSPSFLYSYKVILLGLILAPIVGFLIGLSKGQAPTSLTAYYSYFFKYGAASIVLGSVVVVDTSDGSLNSPYAVSRLLGIAIGATVGVVCSLLLSSPSRRIFRDSLSGISSTLSKLYHHIIPAYYLEEDVTDFYQKGRLSARPLKQKFTSATNILAETNTPALSGLIFRKNGRQRYLTSLRRLERIRYHAIFLFFERTEIVDQQPETLIDAFDLPDVEQSTTIVRGHSFKPTQRGFPRYLQRGAVVAVSNLASQIFSTTSKESTPPGPDPLLVNDALVQVCKSLDQISTSLKSFPLRLKSKPPTEYDASIILFLQDNLVESVTQRVIQERIRVEHALNVMSQGTSWQDLLIHVDPTQLSLVSNPIVLYEYRSILVRLLRLLFDIDELLMVVFGEILVPH